MPHIFRAKSSRLEKVINFFFNRPGVEILDHFPFTRLPSLSFSVCSSFSGFSGSLQSMIFLQNKQCYPYDMSVCLICRFRFKGSLDLSLGGLQRYNGYVDVERIFLFLSSFHYFHFITSLKTLSVDELWLPLNNWLGLRHPSHCYSPICYSCRWFCFANMRTI